MNAVILAIGDELTSGQAVDTNSAYLAVQLAAKGIATLEHITVGDDRRAIADALAVAATKAQVVIVTGGLGPTADDLTRFAVADLLGGAEMQLHAPSLEAIQRFFDKIGRVMVESNKVQAMFPVGAEVLPNEAGTAPGLTVRLGDCDIYVTPGVPREMKWMYHTLIEPRLPQQEGAITYSIVHTFGAGESDVGTAIGDLMQRGANPTVGTTVAAGMVSVRIISRAATHEQACGRARAVADEVRHRLGDLVVGEGDDTLAVVVGRLLRERGQTLATAESCTGGMIGEMLTAVAGASHYYLGGVVSYANSVKQELLGVGEDLLIAHGAVSEPVAGAMAAGVRQRTGSDWAISITGIAGPGGGTEAKPVGTVCIGLARPDGTVETHRHVFPGDRNVLRLRSSLAAMNYLRLAILRG